MKSFKASEIASFLKCPLSGPDAVIRAPSASSNPLKNTIAFCREAMPAHDPELRGKVLYLVLPGIEKPDGGSYIEVSNPRLAFARVLQHFFEQKPQPGIHPTSIIHPTAVIDPSAVIGPFCVVADRVTVGPECQLDSYVRLHSDTCLGAKVYVDSHSVIGSEGFGYEKDTLGEYIRIPHFGNVKIGDDVHIGAHVCIDRGTLGATIIRRGARIDNFVHVAHNCDIGENVIIVASAVISGSVVIGNRCWIAPSATIIQKVHIGDDCLVGMGAVVTKPLKNGSTVAPLPALSLLGVRALQGIIGKALDPKSISNDQ